MPGRKMFQELKNERTRKKKTCKQIELSNGLKNEEKFLKCF